MLISDASMSSSVLNLLQCKAFILQSVMQALPNILSDETDEVSANDIQDAVR